MNYANTSLETTQIQKHDSLHSRPAMVNLHFARDVLQARAVEKGVRLKVCLFWKTNCPTIRTPTTKWTDNDGAENVV